MILPDFSEFVSSVDIKKLKAEFEKATPCHIIQFDLSDTASVEKALALCMQEAAATAARISFSYLRAYHEWLQLQLRP